MNIVLVTETLLPGGAEWFVLRLSKALRSQGHGVNIYVLRPDLIDQRLVNAVGESNFLHLPKPLVKLLLFGDKVLFRFTGTRWLLSAINKKSLSRKIKSIAPDVLHSHLLNCDIVTTNANEGLKVPHITTVHGDYIQAIKKSDRHLMNQMSRAVGKMDGIVTISDEQLGLLQRSLPYVSDRLQKIYNGYETFRPNTIEHSRETFNFGMIARGIPEKGWEVAIKSFLRIQTDEVRLYLYGEGAYLEQLKDKYSDNRILFCGFSNNPTEAVAQMDIGLLPSYYDAESLPTTIIDYLAMSKPVISTGVGEIPAMIDANSLTPAGIIINELNPEEMEPYFAAAMNQLFKDQALYKTLARNCKTAFKKFAMDECVSAYVALYRTKKKELCAES